MKATTRIGPEVWTKNREGFIKTIMYFNEKNESISNCLDSNQYEKNHSKL